MYWQAGAEYGLDWTVLAGIGTIESDNGQSVLPGVSSGTNYAGAAGPAQFENSTWARYGVNTAAKGSQSSPYNAADAITTMAAYLKASGAPQNWQTALYAYNHSDAYVSQVLALAAKYRQ
jgi:membrane-bound lytic murein transglycosylase B